MERTFDLCEQLAQTDLSEDDTKILLKEASDLNRKLKAELKRIEEKEKAKKAPRSQSRTKVQTTSMGRGRPTQNVSMRTSVQKPKPSFLPPIASTSKKTGSHKAVMGNSPYALQKSMHRSRIAANLSTDRQSSSAGV